MSRWHHLRQWSLVSRRSPLSVKTKPFPANAFAHHPVLHSVRMASSLTTNCASLTNHPPAHLGPCSKKEFASRTCDLVATPATLLMATPVSRTTALGGSGGCFQGSLDSQQCTTTTIEYVVCPKDSFLNGLVCISSETPRCPGGTTFNGAQCISSGPPTCPRDSTFDGQWCVSSSIPQCPPSLSFNGKACVPHIPPTCSAGIMFDGQNSVSLEATPSVPVAPSPTAACM